MRFCVILTFTLVSYSMCTNVVIEKNTFETDLDGWTVENGSWYRRSVGSLKQTFPKFPHPPDASSMTVMVPSNRSRSDLSIMHKNLDVPSNTNLEIFFTCIVLGWRRDNDPTVRMRNPVLQILYDEVLVFHLETAINENSGHYSNGKWNQFRLFSSYKSNFTMRVSVMASTGENRDNVVAVDNFVIKMVTNGSKSNPMGAEPEAEVQEKDGEWERIETDSQEDEEQALKNGTLSSAPEFCELLSDKGPCMGAWPRYAYNPATNNCERFVYGGCDGNENNFHVKLACEAICKRPNKTDEHKLLNEEKNSSITNLYLDFENGFGGWDEQFWRILKFDSSVAKVLNITANNKSSKAAASPVYRQNTIFSRRPRLVHPLDLVRNGNITIKFSLKLIGSINPAIHPFFEHMNPGFKIYIGDFVYFDYGQGGEPDDGWHDYTITKETDAILQFPHITNDGSTRQIVRVEAWQGSSERGYIALDDLSITQTFPSNQSTPSTSATESTTKTTSATTSQSSKETATSPASTTSTTASTSTSAGKSSTSVSLLSSTASTSTATTTATGPTTTPGFPCMLQMSAGPCKMKLSRFYYDSSTKACTPFTYGGCKGNANNFETESDCKMRCISPPATGDSDVCSLKEETGVCHIYMERFYFDSKKNVCAVFIYGGCGGNGNNFVSKAECQHVCAHRIDASVKNNPEDMKMAVARTITDCKLPILKGDCSNHINMFAFDQRVHRCTPFTYTGCGGNENLFFTMKECQDTCGSLAAPTTRRTMPTPATHRKARVLPNQCNLPQVSVMCGANESTSSHWYFSKTSCQEEQSCPSHSNQLVNQFPTKAACESVCNTTGVVQSPSYPASPPAGRMNVEFELKDCLLSPKKGTCAGTYSRFFYDYEQRECLEFAYTGCHGNKNNFMTHRECMNTCLDAETKVAAKNVSICEQPKRVGPCKGKLARFFFNTRAQQCESFDYGGCRGNQNRFLTKQLCEATCGSALVERKIESQEESGASAASIAEAVLGVVLLLLAAAAAALLVKYLRVRRAKENYRIFDNEQRLRAGSVASTMAYDNPSYSGDLHNAEEQDANAIQLNGTSYSERMQREHLEQTL